MNLDMTAAPSRDAPLFPAFTRTLLITAILAGAVADITWEFWARAITPLIVGGPLQPAALVRDVFHMESWFWAEVIHGIVGVLFYPLGYLYIARPVARIVTPFLPWWVVAIGFGIGLWVFALYIMAHLVVGLPAFLGFGLLAWCSFVGHVIFGVLTAAVVRWRESAA